MRICQIRKEVEVILTMNSWDFPSNVAAPCGRVAKVGFCKVSDIDEDVSLSDTTCDLNLSSRILTDRILKEDGNEDGNGNHNWCLSGS